jgi:hypothetical protein
MRNYPTIGIQAADILLPKHGSDLFKWATIACDQFTSQPEYWEKVRQTVGTDPSTYHLILPEVYLNTPEETTRVQSTRQAMLRYLAEGLFESYEGMIFVERSVAGRTRHGIMLALDLEKYDFNKGSKTLIRATEGTILDRLPPRMRIREGAALEIPHILVLIDDPHQTVIEPIRAHLAKLPKVYDTDLMLGSGHLTGHFISDPALEQQIVAALERLASPSVFSSKYGVSEDEGVLLFAVGDGNHSLATAKSIWEKIKSKVGMNHPARYALVELENVHDEGLAFEPIHRVIFNAHSDLVTALTSFYGSQFSLTDCVSVAEMISTVNTQTGTSHVIGVITPTGPKLLTIHNPDANLPVGSLQSFLDEWLKQGGAERIDYVHDTEPVLELGSQPGNLGFILPAMEKSDLFKTVVLDGALPRKTFSMGESIEKRFYMECRRIA